MSPTLAQLQPLGGMACPIVGFLLIAGIVGCTAELRRQGGAAPFLDRRKALITGVVACSVLFVVWLAVVVDVYFFAPRTPDFPADWSRRTTATRPVYAP